MPDTIIENPILNSPFCEPDRRWRFTDEGITNEIVETRRASAYFEGIKGDVRNCCGKMPSLRRAGFPESFNSPKQLRISPSPTSRLVFTSFDRRTKVKAKNPLRSIHC